VLLFAIFIRIFTLEKGINLNSSMADQVQNNHRRESYIRNDFMEMWIENGIIHGVYLPNTVVTLAVAKKCVEDRLKIANGRSYPSLVNLKNVAGEEKAARDYYSTGEGIKHVIAGAFIVDSYLPALLANIYLKINRPKVPARLFTYEESALKWLEPFRNQMN
jgi:hypothetical protein